MVSISGSLIKGALGEFFCRNKSLNQKKNPCQLVTGVKRENNNYFEFIMYSTMLYA
ncbi:MAG: hypothetical protein WBQ32_04260 [Ignavibacteriaceae bacterium]